jgi:hypothetical protein
VPLANSVKRSLKLPRLIRSLYIHTIINIASPASIPMSREAGLGIGPPMIAFLSRFLAV